MYTLSIDNIDYKYTNIMITIQDDEYISKVTYLLTFFFGAEILDCLYLIAGFNFTY